MVVTNAIKQKKLITVTRIDKEKTGLSLFAEDMMAYLECSRKSMIKQTKQVQQGSKDIWLTCKNCINTQNNNQLKDKMERKCHL